MRKGSEAAALGTSHEEQASQAEPKAWRINLSHTARRAPIQQLGHQKNHSVCLGAQQGQTGPCSCFLLQGCSSMNNVSRGAVNGSHTAPSRNPPAPAPFACSRPALLVTGFPPVEMGQDLFPPHCAVAWQVRSHMGRELLVRAVWIIPPSNSVGWATQAHGLFQSLISRIHQKTIIKEPSPSGGSLLVSTERREYLADFFFHPANFRPLYNISFNTTQFL